MAGQTGANDSEPAIAEKVKTYLDHVEGKQYGQRLAITDHGYEQTLESGIPFQVKKPQAAEIEEMRAQHNMGY